MHISVIHDIKTIFSNLGHEVNSTCMSGHTWVNNEQQKITSIVNPNNWLQINQDMCDRFYNEYKNELRYVDAFVHSYPPAFALLFEKFNKPVITIACTRFDYPCTTKESLDWLVNGLKRMHTNGQLIPIANNLFDKKYCEEYTNFEWSYISSLCDYMKNSYNPTLDKFIVWNRSNVHLNHSNIENNFTIARPYNRNNNAQYKGIIHIPYNISIMSAFEHYYSNIPLFVPTVPCLERWIKQGKNVLSELYFPVNQLKIKKQWLELSDWYVDSNMPFTIKFDSEDDLYDKMINTNLQKISIKMQHKNAERKEEIYNKWKIVLDGLSC